MDNVYKEENEIGDTDLAADCNAVLELEEAAEDAFWF